MSCFILSPQCHATLANTLEYILNSGFNRFGFDAPRSLHEALKHCRDRYGYYKSDLIYANLYNLNEKAYNVRYRVSKPDPDNPLPEKPNVPQLVQRRQRTNHHEQLLPWHYQFCKLLDCLIYQASEDATRNDPLYLALIDFSRIYKSFLVTNTDAYNCFPWGEI